MTYHYTPPTRMTKMKTSDTTRHVYECVKLTGTEAPPRSPFNDVIIAPAAESADSFSFQSFRDCLGCISFKVTVTDGWRTQRMSQLGPVWNDYENPV